MSNGRASPSHALEREEITGEEKKKIRLKLTCQNTGSCLTVNIIQGKKVD